MVPLTHIAFRLLSAPVILLLLGGCLPRQTQEDLEDEAAASVFRHVNLYLTDHGSISNIAQVYAELDLSRGSRTHPARFQKEFQRFGKSAGFKNSFYEKYVCLPRGTTSSIVGGEIVLMNAQPFPNRSGELGRILFYYVAGDRNQRNFEWFAEQQVEHIFRDAGVPIPPPAFSPLPMPPPVDYQEPLPNRIEHYFREVAHHWNLDRSMGKYLMYGAFLLVAVPVGCVCWYGLRRVQKTDA